MSLLGKVKGVAGDLASRASDLKDLGVEKVQATVEELNTTLPYLAEVGYCVGRIHLEIGLSPKVVLSLAKTFDVEPARFDALLAQLAQYKVFCTILGALRQANQLQGKIQFRGRCFKEVEVELGMPPAVRMVFLEATVAVQLPAAAPASAPHPAAEAAPPAPPPPAPGPVSQPPETSPIPAAEAPPPEAPGPEMTPFLPTEPDLDLQDAEVMTTREPVHDARDEAAPAPPPADAAPAAEGPVPQPAPLPPTELVPDSEDRAAPGSAVPAGDVIRFRCPECNHRVRTTADKVGRLARCKECGTVLKVPAPSTP